MPEEEWRPPARYRGEQDDLEAEARRLAALTREDAAQGNAKARLHARLEGYVPAAEWLEQADTDREQRNGHRTYPGSGLSCRARPRDTNPDRKTAPRGPL